jgi:predicted ATPase
MDALQPGAGVPRTSRTWRGYEIMRLRYGEARTAVEVQSLLALSKSQYYVEHERALESVVAQLWTGGSREPASALSSPPAVILPLPRMNNLPMPLTSFVGRDNELAELGMLLAGTRMLTLTGSAGVGKTRLALEVAAAIAPEFDGHVWFIELGPVADETLVVQGVASALGIREQADRALIETVSAALADRLVFLILDNCEHLLAACAALIERLLQSCMLVRVLATSREALRIDGETIWRVPSLAIADPQSAMALEDLTENGATRLFLDRARAVMPALAVAERDVQAIAEICRRLDGVPLAIELAAARAGMFSVEQIAARLDDAFRLLTSGSRSAPPRQQTLRATLDWSYGLLSEREKLLLDRLSVFAGGWTFEAAEAVASGDGIDTDEVLDLLGRLIDKSLVVAEPKADGTVRYRLLEVVRQYGHEQLAERGQTNATWQRHAAYFLDLSASEPRVLTADRRAWLDLLERELDNFRTARRCFVTSGDAEGAQSLAGRLYRLWMYRGYAKEGEQTLAEALALPGGSQACRARAWFCLGGVAFIQADYSVARDALAKSLTLWRQIGDQAGMAWSLMGLGATATSCAEFDSASTLLDQARQSGRRSGDAAALAVSLAWSADMAYARGEYAPIRAYAEEALEVAQRIGFATPACMALSTLGNLSYREGNRAAAMDHLQEALHRADALGEAYPIVRAALGLAAIAADDGDADNARSLLARSVRLAHRVGNYHHMAQALEALSGFAAPGQPEAALRLASAASAIRESIGAPMSPTEQQALETRLRPAQSSVGTSVTTAALSEGRTWSLDKAAKFALELSEG